MFINRPCAPRCLTFLTCPAAAKISPVSSDDPNNPCLEPISRSTPTSRWCRRWQRWHTQSCVADLALAVKQKSSSCVALAETKGSLLDPIGTPISLNSLVSGLTFDYLGYASTNSVPRISQDKCPCTSLGSLAKYQSKNSLSKLVFVRQLVRSLTQLDQVQVSTRDRHLNNQAIHQLRLWLDCVKAQHASSNAITLLPFMDVIGEWCCNRCADFHPRSTRS